LGVDVQLPARAAIPFLVLMAISRLFAQSPPLTPNRPWHSPDQQQIIKDAQRLRPLPFRIEPGRIYSLAELIDLAESFNPETRVAWESARAQAAALGIARSDLFPTVAAVALAGVDRIETPFGEQFFRQTIASFQLAVDLNYTIFDSARGADGSTPKERGCWLRTSVLTTFTAN
jgi:outer membrane protein TolC